MPIFTCNCNQESHKPFVFTHWKLNFTVREHSWSISTSISIVNYYNFCEATGVFLLIEIASKNASKSSEVQKKTFLVYGVELVEILSYLCMTFLFLLLSSTVIQ